MHEKGLIKGAATVSAANLLSRALGFAQRQIMAYCFGAGLMFDAFTIANQSIGFAFHSIPRQALAPFLPLFIDRRDRDGEAAAWRSAFSVATLLLAVMAVAVLAGILGAPALIALAAGRADRERFHLAVRLVRIVLPAAFLLAAAAYSSLLLNSYKRFAAPAFGESANRLALILATLGLYRIWGITAAAAGVVIGAAVCLGIQLAALRRHAPACRLRIDFKDPALRRLGVLAPPVLAGAVLAVFRTMFDYRIAAGMGAGFVSGLNYARGISDMLIMLAPFALGVAIYPYFSEYSARRDFAGLSGLLMRTCRLLVFFFAPMAVGLVLLREAAVTLAFARGAFDAQSVSLTAAPLAFLAVGLPAFAVEIVLMQAFFAMKDTRTPILAGIGALFLHVACVLWLHERMGHSAIALAITVSKTAKNIALYILLRRKECDLQLRPNALFAVKLAVCLILMTSAVVLVRGIAPLAPDLADGAARLSDAARLAVFLTSATAAGGGVFILAARILRMTEARLLNGRRRINAGRNDEALAKPPSRNGGRGLPPSS